jgi:pimeloyl-ACP methyl ester carboxylesterase
MKSTLLILVFILLINKNYAQDNSMAEYVEAKKTYEKFLDNHSRIIPTTNGDLHYLSWGKESDPTLFWLHGSYSNAIEIEPFVKKFISEGFRVISIDYYGHGQTPYSSDTLSLENLLEDINNLSQHLKLEKIILGGFSRGAYIAAAYYNKYQNDVAALILEDGGVSPFLGHLLKLTQKQLKDFIEIEANNRPPELFKEYNTEFDAYEAIKIYSDTSQTERYKNFCFIQLTQQKYNIYVGFDTIYGMQSYESLSQLMKKNLVTNLFANQLMERNYTDIVKSAKIPTLLLEARSEIDLYEDSVYFEKCKMKNSLIQHKIFKKSSHTIHFDQPEEFITTIIDFLNTIQHDYTRSTTNSR